jgi:hypothetical protein
MPRTKEETIVIQNAWLAAYGEVGTVRKACMATDVPRSTYYNWIENNIYNFKEKQAIAHEIFGEYVRDLALDRIEGQGPKDNPVLLMSFLNAFAPQYFKRDSSTGGDAAKEFMVELKKLRAMQEDIRKDNKEVDKEDSAKKRAMDEVEKILSRQRESDDDNE